MTRLTGLAVSSMLLVLLARPAPASEESVLWVTDTDGRMESGWMITVPSGSSDFFNVAHSVVTQPHTDEVSALLPVTALSISVGDFGSALKFPRAGVYQSNLGLDPTGATPDLSRALVQVFNPTLSPSQLFDFVTIETNEAVIPAGTTKLHAVVQIPPNDSGQLVVGADTSSAVAGTSFASDDSYQQPAQPFPGNLGLNIGQDNGTTKSDGRMRVSGRLGDQTGDRLSVTVSPGKDLQLAMFTPHANDKWILFLATNGPSCGPLVKIGGVLPVTADPDGDGGFLRTGIHWPIGFGGQTFKFVGAFGDTNVGGHGFSNCVTVFTRPEKPFGTWDDGNIDDGWFVSLPSGPSDYFSVDFLAPPSSVRNLVGITLAPLDFGTPVSSFPKAGVAGPNTALDATGLTPDLANPLAVVAPFTFPAGTMATTSASYITRAVVPVPGRQLPQHTHGFVQFPVGDSGLLAIGADTDSEISSFSTWTRDGYATAAKQVLFANWGIRLATN